MCQHGMVNKRLYKSSFFDYIYINFIGRNCQWLFIKFKLPLSCIGQLWYEGRPLLNLVSFQIFRSSPCTTCFVLLIMRLDPKFRVFPLRAPHCAFYVFRCGLLFELWYFLFLLLFSCQVFFLYLLIDLFQFTKNMKGFFQCCSGIKFIRYQPGVGIKIHFILRYQASTVILVFSELSPVWSWYRVHN